MGTKTYVSLVAVVVATALGASLIASTASTASADELTDQRYRVKQQLAQTRSQLNESSRQLESASDAVVRAEDQLSVAQAELDQTQDELAAAKVEDTRLAAKLKRAKVALAKARAAVIAGQAKLDAKRDQAGDMMRQQYQQQTNLLPIAVLVEAGTTADLQTRIQWSTTMFDTTRARLDELAAIQRRLDAEKARQTELEAEVAADRLQAAANLATKKRLEAQAEQQQASVARLLGQRQAARSAAADDVAQDKQHYAELTRERASVEQRIAVRIARAKAEQAAAARRAAAQAAKAAAQARKASRASKASPRSSQRSSTPVRRSSSSSSSGGGTSASSGFAYPVSAGITSAFGMRFHPVLRYWKLHDGTDFGAGCGAPIRAPYAGRVAERYFNPGYGNRLMIDHGNVGGRYITTGYNHAIRYTVGVGQRVSKGQVIGYVGTTGYSTGCHLHLMVWKNGRIVNPMTWF